MQNNKVPGEKVIVIKTNKEKGNELILKIVELFNLYLAETFSSWDNSIITIRKPLNFISILLQNYKLLMKFITKSLNPKLDFHNNRQAFGSDLELMIIYKLSKY